MKAMVAGLAVFCAMASGAGAEPSKFRDANGGYVRLMQNHFSRVIDKGTDQYGPDHSGLWLASIDIIKGGQPQQADPKVKRTYRQIHSPRGSNLYWDQPYVAAAHNLSRLTNDQRYRQAADRYVRDFLSRCVSVKNGLFLWGNHIYYDVFTDKTVSFSGGYHEARPLPCAWEIFWTVDRAKTERAIYALGELHIRDQKTGLFDRHASVDATRPPAGGEAGGYPFLEAGGVIVESLAWLSAKTDHRDPMLCQRALAVARLSFSHKGEKTGLLRNQCGPNKRWDYHAATTEVGLWANCLLRSADYLQEKELADMAHQAVAAYLRYGYDERSGRFYGQLNVSDGMPRKPQRQAGAGDETIYQPGEYADLWEALFPTHNYPMCLAEACLTLYQRNREDQFKQAVQRFARFIAISTPANGGKGAYADQYGRCIHFLLRAADVMGEPKYFEQAKGLAREAVSALYSSQAGMFRSHPGEDRCDAVDGMGILFLALMKLESGQEADAMGFGW